MITIGIWWKCRSRLVIPQYGLPIIIIMFNTQCTPPPATRYRFLCDPPINRAQAGPCWHRPANLQLAGRSPMISDQFDDDLITPDGTAAWGRSVGDAFSALSTSLYASGSM